MAPSDLTYDPGRSVSRVNVAVAVAEDARGRIYEVAAECRALGLEHTSTLADIGVLTGSVEYHDLAKLRAIPDVVAVELER
jgi:precorrin-6B methylase 2